MDAPKRYHPALVTLHWLIVLLVFTNLYLGIFIFERPPRGFNPGSFQTLNTLIVVHMITGITILILLLVRFVTRIRTKRPAEATAGNKFFDFLAKLVHYGLYAMVLVTTILGLTFSLQSGRFQRAFLGARDNFGPGNGNFPAFQGTPGAQRFPNFQGTPGAQGFPNGNGQGFQGGGNGNGGGNFPGGGRPNGGNFGRERGGLSLLMIHEWSAYLLLFLIVVHVLAWAYHQFIRRDHLISRMWYGAR